MLSKLRLACLALVMSVAIAPSTQAADTPPKDIVVAKVNGQQVMLSEIETIYNGLPAPYRQTPLDELFPKLVDQLIDQKLAMVAAKKAKIEETAAYKEKMARFAEEAMLRTFIQQELDKRTTDAQLKEAYQVLVRSMKEERKTRHILVATEDDAKKARSEAMAGDFAKVASKYSKDTASKGGDLGWIHQDQVVKEFGAIAFQIKENEVSQPVKSQFGWHIIKVEGIRKQEPPKFEDAVKPLKDELQQGMVRQVLADLRKGATIERFDSLGRPLPKMP